MGGGMLLGLGLVLSYVCLTITMKVNESAQSELYDRLLNGNMLVRPVRNWSKPVEVGINFILIQINELNSVDQTLSVSGVINMVWRDEYMTWNKSENGIHRILVPSQSIWTPEFSIYNSADGSFRDSSWREDYDPLIYSNGNVVWNPSGLFFTSCHMDILYFPFDTQQCGIVISNWMQHSSEILFRNMSPKVDTSRSMPSREWNLKDTSLQAALFRKEGLEADVSTVRIMFVLERRHKGYINNILIPLIIISTMALLVFPLSVESGEKISLGVTMLLAFSVFQLVISDSLPQNSEHIPYILWYVVTLMAMNASSIAMTVLVLHFHHKDPAPRLPRWARKLLFDFLGKIVCAGSSGNNVLPDEEYKTGDVNTEEVLEEGLKMKGAEYIDNILTKVMSDTLKEVQKITKKMQEVDEEDGIKEEWRRAAGILDRFLLLLSTVAWLLATIILLSIMSSSRA